MQLQRLLEGWAFRSPVLLAVDDLHHADARTVDAVLHVVDAVRRHRLFVVMTTRPPPFLDPSSTAALRRLQRRAHLDAITLAALDDADLAALVEARTGCAPSPRLLRLLGHRSGGTPFFAIELLDAMSRSGDLATAGGVIDAAESAERAMPTRVSTAVLHRVFGLGADARLVASAIAVVGHVPLDPSPLLVALDVLDADRTMTAFGRLVDARIVVPSGDGYRFSHAIVRDAVYDDIGPAARRRMHGRVARALATGGPWGPTDVVEIAGHVERSTAGRDAAAAALLARAGDSVADSSPQAAAGWYRAALARIGPTGDSSIDLQLRLSRVLDLGGDHADAARLAEAAMRAADDPATRVTAVTGAARAHVAAGRWTRAAELLDQAAADPTTRTPRLLVHLALTLLWTDRQHEATALVDEARASGGRPPASVVDSVELHRALATGAFERARELERDMRRRLGDGPPASMDTTKLSVAAANGFDFEPATAVALAGSVPDGAPLAPSFTSIAAWARYRQGRFVEAERLAVDVRDAVGGTGGGLATGLWLATLIASRVERADAAATEAVARAADHPVIPIFESGVETARAMWHRERGEHDQAAELLAAAAHRERSRGQLNILAGVLAHQVDAASGRGDASAAATHNAELQSRRGDGSIALTMQCLLAQAVAVGDRAAAVAAREHGLRHGLAADAGRALGILGVLDGDPGLLADAYRELGRLGAVLRQRVVAHELRRLGHRVPHGPSGGDLSPVESEVVGLVVAGMTNRQIAERMGLSPKTVEVYLSRIYTKTGNRSRVELAVSTRDGTLTTA